MQYTDTYNENILSFVNNVKTSDGGTHEVGFKTGITKAFNDYAKNNNIFKAKDGTLDGSDVREGLSAVISLKIPEELLQFEGQTKGKLGTPEARSVTESITYESLKFFLEENKEVASTILEKAMKSKVAREAARKAREDARNGKNNSKIEKNLSMNSMCVRKNATLPSPSRTASVAPLHMRAPFISTPIKFTSGNIRPSPTQYSPRPQPNSRTMELSL